MTDTPSNKPDPTAAQVQGVIDRAKNMVLKPQESWAAIDGEAATVQSIYVPYVLVLAAIGPVAQFIGGQAFGFSLLGVTYRPPMGSALATMILSYGFALASVYIVALVIDALAPTFGGQKNPIQALKVAAYSATAGWLAGIFGLVPALAVLGLLGLYSLYLLYLGLPMLMKAPPEKALGYTAVVVLVAAVVIILVGAIVGALAS
ncbi:MAG: Yip1 family protein [Sphingopyxis sp.]|uniref:Yip1 family protein n=1 Tax=Sphingopyxis sp. TaxID=1908224 RepID=UPI002ABCE71B|nr:Yip1 family protein [Sphingopyxis sp.]MDZ3830842.1 Yip1 family protein [Sphingopyxis sp.]